MPSIENKQITKVDRGFAKSKTEPSLRSGSSQHTGCEDMQFWGAGGEGGGVGGGQLPRGPGYGGYCGVEGWEQDGFCGVRGAEARCTPSSFKADPPKLPKSKYV